MKSDSLLHYSHFLVLLVMILTVLVMVFFFKGLPDKQFMIVVIAAVLYFFWGCLYHLFKGDFHPKIMVEYLLIAVMAVLLLRGAIYR